MIIIVKMWDSAASFVAVNLLLEEQGNSLSEGQFDLISGGCVTDLLLSRARSPWPGQYDRGSTLATAQGIWWLTRPDVVIERRTDC